MDFAGVDPTVDAAEPDGLSGLGSLLLRPVDSMIPGAARLAPEELSRRRLLVSFSGLISLFGYFFAWEAHGSGDDIVSPLALVIGASIGVANIFTLRTRFAPLAKWILVGVMLGVMTILPFSGSEGLWNSSLWWDLPIPLVAAFLISTRVALVTTAIIIVEIMVLFARTEAPHLGSDASMFRAMASISAVGTITVLAWIHERAREAGELRVRTALAEQRKANDRLRATTNELEHARRAAETDSARKTDFLSRMRMTAGGQGAALDETSAAMAQMAATFRSVAQSIETLAGAADDSGSAATQIHAQAEEAVTKVGAMVSAVELAAKSLQAMSFSVQEVAANVDDLSSVAEETSTSMSEMSASIVQVEQNARATEALAESVIADAEQGAAAVLHTRAGMENILDSSRAMGETIGSLSRRVQDIDRILEVIDEIAGQTRLLSLNAAIIASQAGKHGRGFGVVAGEIKQLAERTGASTQEIAALIAGVQDEASRAVQAMAQGEVAVTDGLERSADAERALAEIVDRAHGTTRMVKSISLATQEQTRASSEVATAMGRLAVSVTEIAAATTEQSRGADSLLTSTDYLQQLAGEVDVSSREQRDGSRRIEHSVEQVNQMVQKLQDAQAEQTRGTELVLDSVEAIHKGQLEQIASIEQLDASEPDAAE